MMAWDCMLIAVVFAVAVISKGGVVVFWFFLHAGADLNYGSSALKYAGMEVTIVAHLS